MGDNDTPCETDWRSRPLYALATLCEETPKEQTPEKEREAKPEPDKAPSSSDYCVVADSSNDSIVSSIGDPNFVTDSSETTSQDDETMIVQAVLNRLSQTSDTSLSRCLRSKRKPKEFGSSIGTPSLKRLKSSPQSPLPLAPPIPLPNLALNTIAVSRCAGKQQWSNGTGHKNASTTTRTNPNAKKTIVPFVANKWWAEERSRNLSEATTTTTVPFVANKWWAKERRNVEKAKTAICVVPFVADKWWAKK